MFKQAPSQLNLTTDELHLWLVSLLRSPAELDGFLKTFSPDEVERSANIKINKAKKNYIAARGILRILLGRYLKISPEQIVFDYGKAGKPQLLSTDLQFNLSHSGDYAFYGICQSAPIGVDIENEKKDMEFEAIAQRFFSHEEYQAIKALPEKKKCAGFFDCWTKKEAWVKALGTGLRHPLSEFTVSLSSDPIPIRNIHETQHWTLFSVKTIPHYHAAVATKVKPKKIALWSY